MPTARQISRAVLALLLLVAALTWVLPCSADDPCEDPRNIIYNCQFERFSPAPGGEVPEGWWPFVLSGHPAFDRASDTPKPPSLRIWSDGEPFVAGVYQEVSGVQPGATYVAGIGWAVFQSTGPEMGRAIGIDPRGGKDPASPDVVWSTEVWEKRRINPELVVSAVAQSERLTVFVRVNHPRSYGADEAFLDAVWLWRDDSVPVQFLATATQPGPGEGAESTKTATSTPGAGVAREKRDVGSSTSIVLPSVSPGAAWTAANATVLPVRAAEPTATAAAASTAAPTPVLTARSGGSTPVALRQPSTWAIGPTPRALDTLAMRREPTGTPAEQLPASFNYAGAAGLLLVVSLAAVSIRGALRRSSSAGHGGNG